LTFLRHFGHRFIASPPFGRESSRADAQRRPRLALTALSCAMSTPPSERRRLERELAGLLLELGDPRDQLEASPAGLLGHFRRRRLARQLAGLEDRITNALGSSSGWGLVSRCRPAPSRLVCVWRTCRAHRSGRSSVGIGSTPRSDGHSGGSSDGAGRRTRGYGAVRAGAGGGVVAGCAIRAPQEQASQTYPLSLPPSRSPHR
jgi:hypothetical protein